MRAKDLLQMSEVSVEWNAIFKKKLEEKVLLKLRPTVNDNNADEITRNYKAVHVSFNATNLQETIVTVNQIASSIRELTIENLHRRF